MPPYVRGRGAFAPLREGGGAFAPPYILETQFPPQLRLLYICTGASLSESAPAKALAGGSGTSLPATLVLHSLSLLQLYSSGSGASLPATLVLHSLSLLQLYSSGSGASLPATLVLHSLSLLQLYSSGSGASLPATLVLYSLNLLQLKLWVWSIAASDTGASLSESAPAI